MTHARERERSGVAAFLVAMTLAVAATATARAATPAALPAARRAAEFPSEVMDEVVVTGERAGPGLWHIHRGGAHLWVLGTVSPLPKDMQWRSKQLEQVLDGADEVLVAKPFEVGFARVMWLLITQRDLLLVRGGKHLRDVLPANLYARFALQRAKISRDPDKWERLRPIIAIAFLQESALHKVGLSTRLDLGTEVRALARKHRVRVEEIEMAGLRDVLDALRTVPTETENTCVAASLSTIESGLPRLVDRARAWATGNVELIQRLPETAEIDACRSALTGDAQAADLLARIHRTWLAGFDERLRHGGVTIAVVNMDLLLQPGGLLDDLRAQGFEVDGP
jgi:uncharacterized protein YbaP (TraB family)